MRVCSSGRPGGFRGFSLPQAQARQGEGCGRIYPNSYRRRNWRPPLGESEADCPAAAWLDKAGRPGRNRGMRPEGGLRSRAKHRLICVTVAHGTCLGTAAACRAEQQCGPCMPNFRYLGLGQSTTDHDVQPNGPPGGLAGAARRPAVGRSESGSACRSLLGREAASATEDEESCSSRQLDRCRLEAGHGQRQRGCGAASGKSNLGSREHAGIPAIGKPSCRLLPSGLGSGQCRHQPEKVSLV